MLQFLSKRWFLIALVVLLTSGFLMGSSSIPAFAAAHEKLKILNPRFIVGFVLLLMSFSLDSRHFKASLRSPGPVIWASVVNFGVIPLLGLGMMSALIAMDLPNDLALGLMIAASVPCTLAAASVWTRKAGGNDAVSLLVTLSTNTLCFVLTPFWLRMATSDSVDDLDTMDLVLRLCLVVLLPTLAGQALRQLPKLGDMATRYKTPIGVVAQSCILILVLNAGFEAGSMIQSATNPPQPSAFVIVWIACILIHVTAMTLGYWGAVLMKTRRVDRIAVMFSSSQKTLPIGLFLAIEVFGNVGTGFAVIPMLMYHASQLFIDTEVAVRLKSRGELMSRQEDQASDQASQPDTK